MKPYLKIVITAIVLSFSTANSYCQKTTAKWITYTNTRYGFSFQYPATWVMDNDSDIVVAGVVASRSIQFTDPLTKTFLLISYSLSKGTDIYNFYVKNYDPSHSKHLKVAGNEAIQITTDDKRNGKGKLLNRKDWRKETNTEFLDKNKTGEFELKFSAYQNSSLANETKKLNQLVAGFKFFNKIKGNSQK